LSTADWNHGVDRHNAGLHRLAHAPALDDAGRDFFHRIKGFGIDRPLVINRLAECVDDPAKERLAHRHLKQTPGRFDLIAFRNPGRIAEKDDADFRFFEVKREPEVAARELDHLVQHHLAQALDPGHAVTGFAHHADVAFGGRGFQPRDLRFNFFQNAAHDNSLG
jgi:hypothetical protein